MGDLLSRDPGCPPAITCCASFPDFGSRFAPLGEMRALCRALSPAAVPNEIGFDAQMVIPTRRLLIRRHRCARAPLDQPDKLVSGLLYLRAAEDELHRWRA